MFKVGDIAILTDSYKISESFRGSRVKIINITDEKIIFLIESGDKKGLRAHCFTSRAQEFITSYTLNKGEGVK